MEIKQKNTNQDGMFFIEQDGVIVAKMIYYWLDEHKISINHTEVSEVLKGTGAGKKMLNKAVDFAREKGLKIIPLCSFAKGVFDKVDEFKDVL